MTPDDVLGLEMLAFVGETVSDELRERLARAPAAGVTLFRHLNVRGPEQVRALADEVQAAARARPGAAGEPPVLVAADQEGGQLAAIGQGTTPFAGNMALGAAGDPGLAERIGRAVGTELRAMGITVNYAPVCDLATNPANPSVGIRSFGDDPEAAAALAAATVRGLQSAGVAATLKHLPGSGDLSVDPHHALPVLAHDRARLETVELVPFRAAIAAGARLAMPGHVAVPALTGSSSAAATVSAAIIRDLLRTGLGFEGVTISDALDMGALAQDERLGDAVVAAVGAGLDLLLTTADGAARERIEGALARAVADGRFDDDAVAASAARTTALRSWLAGVPVPSLEVVGGADHHALARDLAERSVTLVRDTAGLLPLRPGAGTRIAAFQPRPRDVTPADTTSTVAPALAGALRAWLPDTVTVDEYITDSASGADIAASRERAIGHDLLIVGTDAATIDPAGADLARALIATGVPTVTVALRTPWDLAAYPAATTHICTFGILPPSLDALARALVGRIPFRGRLPVAVAGIADWGSGILT